MNRKNNIYKKSAKFAFFCAVAMILASIIFQKYAISYDLENTAAGMCLFVIYALIRQSNISTTQKFDDKYKPMRSKNVT